jgi:hypothetical protein
MTGKENPDLFQEVLYEKFKTIETKYPGISLKRIDQLKWIVNVPDGYRVGHEAHFGQVTEKFLEYIQDGRMPDWEVPNMITKYYTIIRALDLARDGK